MGVSLWAVSCPRMENILQQFAHLLALNLPFIRLHRENYYHHKIENRDICILCTIIGPSYPQVSHAYVLQLPLITNALAHAATTMNRFAFNGLVIVNHICILGAGYSYQRQRTEIILSAMNCCRSPIILVSPKVIYA